MAKDADKVVVAATGTVYVAAVGTTPPTDATASLAGGFVDLGYVSEDGVTVTIGKNVEELRAWQSAEPVRRIVTARSMKASFNLMEWKELTLEVAADGNTGNTVQLITLSGFDGTDSFKLTYNGTETAAFVRGTNATAAAIQTALRTATGDATLGVSGTTDAGPFTVTFTATTTPIYALTVTSGTGGTTGTVVGSKYKLAPLSSSEAATSSFAFIIQWLDGANDYRLYIPRAIVVEDVEFNLARTTNAGLPVTIEATVDVDTDAPWTLFSDMAALDPDTE